MAESEVNGLSVAVSSGVDRREFLTLAGAAVAGVLGPTVALRGEPVSPRGSGRVARNVIFMVSDGMSAGTLQLADLYLRELKSRGSSWVEFTQRPGVRRALMDTRSADSFVTDSAAASTAWGTGVSVNNGSIGLTPDGRMPTPLLVHARQAGKATGLVTTTRLTHATPAGFVANVKTNRDDEAAIAPQLLDRGVDVMLGGGRHFLTTDLLSGHADVDVVRTAGELAVAPEDPLSMRRRLVGVFSEQHMSMDLDRPESEPSLVGMTRAALSRLSRGSNGFVVQIEGGRVDHAAHANDAAGLVRDQIAFDEALTAAMEFVFGREDTLLIVCSDHGNGNPGLTDYGAKGIRGFMAMAEARRSFEWVAAELGKHGPEPSASALREVVMSASGIELTDLEVGFLRRAVGGEPVDPSKFGNGGLLPLGSVLSNHYAIAWASGNHTADFVELTAWGPGSERVPAYLRNADLHGVVVAALELPPARAV